jgi:transcriptional regulator with XRE-family HTH domain
VRRGRSRDFKTSRVAESLPPLAAKALGTLGEHLSIARLRRNDSQRQWAQRLGVSVPTLIRLERGDPGVAMGVYATALWMVGRVQALGDIADPKGDLGALERDVRRAVKRRTARSSTSCFRSSLGQAGAEAMSPLGYTMEDQLLLWRSSDLIATLGNAYMHCQRVLP